MTKINYKALREAAERAIPAMESLLMLPVDDDLISEQELKDYGVDIDALNAFKFLTGPETVLALLGELDKWQQESSAWHAVAEKQLALAADAEKRIADLEARGVIPDEMTPKQASRSYCGEVRGYRDGWNDCRAAMLHCADDSLAHEGKNHPEDKLSMVDHFGDSNNMVEPVIDNTNQQFESLAKSK